LKAPGFAVEPEAFFDTITVEVGVRQAGILAARGRGAEPAQGRADRVGISAGRDDRRATLRRSAARLRHRGPAARATLGFPEECCAAVDYLTHPVFHMNRAEIRDDALHAPLSTATWRWTGR
jgi:glycine dehydrogenase